MVPIEYEHSVMPIATRVPRTRIAQFRLTEEEYAQAQEQADAAGMTFSSYCRARVLGHRVLASADRATIRELRRLGGLLKLVHTESRRAYNAQTAGLLADIAAFITRIARQ